MAAKIIKFPVDPRIKAQGTPRAAEKSIPLDLAIELIGTKPALLRNARVYSDDSLADLHQVIAGLFGWDGSHNYFFSHGSNRYEDPELFRINDSTAARCRKIYRACDVPVGNVLIDRDAPLFYIYNLGNCWELRISLCNEASLKQFG